MVALRRLLMLVRDMFDVEITHVEARRQLIACATAQKSDKVNEVSPAASSKSIMVCGDK